MVETGPDMREGKVELLAPAGGLPSFFAALDSGADAVYCGLSSFSARARAKNFDSADLPHLVACAHAQGAKFYVALNTLIKERELDPLLESLSRIADSGVDALIVQDLGVARLVRRYFQGLALHASTQMTVHNAAGVNVLATLGFIRVVLARELSLEEIGAIRANSSLELEHFVHGALCFSISGQCLFSSFRRGQSGNRGRCEQLCRRRYLYQERPGYYFSTADFCALEYLPDLIGAGITSLKIEGRMKNAEYVGRVVKAYRLLLDAPPGDRRRVLGEAKRLLADSYGRVETSAFLAGRPSEALPPPERRGSMGKRLGTVERVRGGGMEITLADRLHVGDRIKLLPPDDRPGAGMTVRHLAVGNKPVKLAGAGVRVTVGSPPEMRAVTGSAVYKLGGREAFALGEAACRKRLVAVRPLPVALTLEITVDDQTLTVAGTAGGVRLRESYPIETSPACKSPLDEAILARTFARTGDCNFALAGLAARIANPVVIPPSRLNEIRRDFYARLCSAREQFRRLHLAHLRRDVLTPPPGIATDPTGAVMVRVADATTMASLDLAEITDLLLPLDRRNLAAVLADSKGEAQRRRLVWELPPLVFPMDWPDLAGLVAQARSAGYRRFLLDNIGHLDLFPPADGLELMGGPRLSTMNSQAALAWRERGLTTLTLPLEGDRDNLRALRERLPDLAAWLVIFSPVPLMTSRIPLAGEAGDIFRDDKGGEGLRLYREKGVTILEDCRPFSLFPHLVELRELGCHRFRLDPGRDFDPEQTNRLLAALAAGVPCDPAATCGNFERGLE